MGVGLRACILGVAGWLAMTMAWCDAGKALKPSGPEGVALLLIADAAGIEPSSESLTRALKLLEGRPGGLDAIRRSALEIGLKLDSADIPASGLTSIDGPLVALERDPDQYAVYMLRGPQGVQRLDSGGVRLASWVDIGRRYTGRVLRMRQGVPRPSEVAVAQFSLAVDVQRPGQTARGEFYLTNKGTEPLQIKLREVSCSCATAVSDADPAKPGGSIRVTIQAEPEGAGRSVYTATYSTNDPYWPKVVLMMEVNVPQTARLYPEALFVTLADSRPSAEEEVTLSAPAGTEVKNVKATAPWLEASLGSKRVIDAVVQWPVRISVLTSVGPGESHAEVIAELTGGDVQSVRLPVTVRKFGGQ